MVLELLARILDKGPCNGRHKGICTHAEQGIVEICGVNNPDCKYSQPLQRIVRYEIIGERLPFHERIGEAKLGCSYQS